MTSVALDWMDIQTGSLFGKVQEQFPYKKWRPGRSFVRTRPGAEVDVATTSGKQVERGPAWSVHKFGGTCVANPERIKNVAQIIIEDTSSKKVGLQSAPLQQLWRMMLAYRHFSASF